MAGWYAAGWKTSRILRMPVRILLWKLWDRGRKQVRRCTRRWHWNLPTERQLLQALHGRFSSTAEVHTHFASRHMPWFFTVDLHSRIARESIANHFPGSIEETIAEADAICAHQFQCMGFGRLDFGQAIAWHTDPRRERRWPLAYYASVDYLARQNDSGDVKVPWEVSRFYHAVPLGKAYWYTGDERYAREFVEQVTDWIRANPPLLGIHWASPMEVALRVINLVWGYYLFRASESLTASFHQLLLRSLLIHGRYLACHLEYSDVTSNHYLTNGLGLFCLGTCFPEFEEASRWQQVGRRILTTEILKQIHEDGVNFEQSLAYHRFVAEICCTAAILGERNGMPFSGEILRRLEQMLEFSLACTKPDGTCPMIGDDHETRVQHVGPYRSHDHRPLLAIGAVMFDRPDMRTVAGEVPEDLFWLLGPAGVKKFLGLPDQRRQVLSRAFPAGGYFILRDAEDYMILDCGPVGTAGRGGHAHNDILSFELFTQGQTFLTDSGDYVYSSSPTWRDWFRGTASHNGLMIDGVETSRLGPSIAFLQDDARPRVLIWQGGQGFDYFSGEHMGYLRLRQPVVHRREVLFLKGRGLWMIRDLVYGKGTHRYDLLFHAAAGLEIDPVDDLAVRIKSGRGYLVIRPMRQPGLERTILESWVAPRYGCKEKAGCLRYSLQGEAPQSFLTCLESRTGAP